MSRRSGESVLRWFDHTERREDSRNAKSVYEGRGGVYGRNFSGWIDSVNYCLKNRGLGMR